MMSISRPPIIFISPPRYVQGAGAMDDVGTYLKPLGTRVAVIVSTGGWERFGDRVQAAAARAGLSVFPYIFSGESSWSQIHGGQGVATDHGCDVVLGLGGGKAADVAKAVGARHGCPWVVLPTTVSNDAPTSSFTVVYADDGEFEEYVFHGRSPEIVIVDSQVVADAPARYLSAGMADAVSTRFESAACAAAMAANISGGRPSATALALGALAWDVIREHGESALRAVERSVVTESLELVIEVNTLYSGLGFESGGFCAAHSIHNGLTTIRALDDALHGEKVNFGVLAMMILERRGDAELRDYVDFSRRLCMPVTLAELGGTQITDEEIHAAAEATVAPGEGIHLLPFPVTADMVAAAIVTADRFAEATPADPRRAGAQADAAYALPGST
jgi:glycerol dehydrogenase